jgi:hypothetical protein
MISGTENAVFSADPGRALADINQAVLIAVDQRAEKTPRTTLKMAALARCRAPG